MGTKEPKSRKYVINLWPVQDVWYWDVRGSNGRAIAVCPGVGYTSKRNAANAVASLAKVMGRRFFTVKEHATA